MESSSPKSVVCPDVTPIWPRKEADALTVHPLDPSCRPSSPSDSVGSPVSLFYRKGLSGSKLMATIVSGARMPIEQIATSRLPRCCIGSRIL